MPTPHNLPPPPAGRNPLADISQELQRTRHTVMHLLNTLAKDRGTLASDVAFAAIKDAPKDYIKKILAQIGTEMREDDVTYG